MYWQVLNLAINFLQNRQFAKLKTSPKFPTIRYVQPSLSPSLTLCPSLQYGRGGFGEGEGKEVESSEEQGDKALVIRSDICHQKSEKYFWQRKSLSQTTSW